MASRAINPKDARRSTPHPFSSSVKEPERGLKTTAEGSGSQAERCTVKLEIHRIEGLGLVKHRRACIRATASFNGLEFKSDQALIEISNLTKHFTFEWEISPNEAKNFVNNRQAIKQQIGVTVTTENDQVTALRKWTHIIGTALLPGKQVKHGGGESMHMEPTEMERNRLEIFYTVKVEIGKTSYNV